MDLCVRPTPVERAPWLDGPHDEVWIKRDDLSSPLYGGSKVRKLEWILANPPFCTDEPIVSVGGIGSHHLLALALFLREQGRVLHGLTFEQVLTPHIRRNLAVLVSCGAQLWHVKTRARLPWAWLGYHVWRRPDRMGRWMAAGASTALGCFGFVEAAAEFVEQVCRGEAPMPKTIFVTAGSAGASAGLTLGFALAKMPVHLHLVSSVEPWAFNRVLFHRKMAETLTALRRCGLRDDPGGGVRRLLADAGVTYDIDHRQVGGGYGVPTPAASSVVELCREHELHLETTYTAKCVAALRDARALEGPVLFWNTHGSNDLTQHIVPGWESRAPIPIPPSNQT